MGQKELICSNCGAQIQHLDAKCPFCGHINLSGAEHEFMENMYRTEDNLEDLTNQQVDDIKKEVKKNTKFIAIIAGIVIAVVLVISGIFFLNNLYWEKISLEGDPKEVMLWQKENFPKLDAMYEAGEYDAILDFIYSLYNDEHESIKYSVFEWEHYNFIDAYDKYRVLLEYEGELDKNGSVDDFEAKYMLYYGMWLYYRQYDQDFLNYSEEEFERIDTEYRDEAARILFDRMQFTNEELDEAYETCMDQTGYYIDPSKCDKIAKKIYKRIR